MIEDFGGTAPAYVDFLQGERTKIKSYWIRIQREILGDIIEGIENFFTFYKVKDERKPQIIKWLARRIPEHYGFDPKILHERTGIRGPWPKPKRVMLVRRPRNSKHRPVDKGEGEPDDFLILAL